MSAKNWQRNIISNWCSSFHHLHAVYSHQNPFQQRSNYNFTTRSSYKQFFTLARHGRVQWT